VPDVPRSLGTLTVWQSAARVAPGGSVVGSTQTEMLKGNVPLAQVGMLISTTVRPSTPPLPVTPLPMGLLAQSKRFTVTPSAALPPGHATTTEMGMEPQTELFTVQLITATVTSGVGLGGTVKLTQAALLSVASAGSVAVSMHAWYEPAHCGMLNAQWPVESVVVESAKNPAQPVPDTWIVTPLKGEPLLAHRTKPSTLHA